MRKLLAGLLILLGIAFMLLAFAAAAIDLLGPFPGAQQKSLSLIGSLMVRLTQLLNALRELIEVVVKMPQWLLFAIVGLVLIFSGMRFWDSGKRSARSR